MKTNETDASGKYLTFLLGGEEYGVEILRVREIIGLMTITPLPQMPSFMRGVINLRGSVIPVMDLRARFAMPSVPDTEQTCIIVIECKTETRTFSTGILVDCVKEVLDISENDIEDPPQFGSAMDSRIFLGMAKAEGCVKILLNIQRVLEGIDWEKINKGLPTEQAEQKERAGVA